MVLVDSVECGEVMWCSVVRAVVRADVGRAWGRWERSEVGYGEAVQRGVGCGARYVIVRSAVVPDLECCGAV